MGRIRRVILPILTYANTVWDDQDEPEEDAALENMALRSALDEPYYVSNKRNDRDLGWTPLLQTIASRVGRR